MIGYIIYFLLLVSVAFMLPSIYFDPGARQFILFLGGISLWRYSWALTHFSRSLIYRKWVFPRWRKRANALGDDGRPEHVFLLLTTFRIGTEVSVRVYREAVRDAIACGVPVTMIASIVEISEEHLVKSIFFSQNPPPNVKLKIVRIAGTGKRDALAAAFRAVANTPVNLERSVVSVVDGDSILSVGSTEACYRLFALNPKLGAVTTDEICSLDGEERVVGVYRRWYSMRFAQRHIYMSSMGLSKRVLTLTGRMSMFRASIVAEQGFINTVQYDQIDHWRLGRFRFLTGDDKSSWYYLLKNGWEMWYVPDVTVLTIEEPVHSNFFVGANMLMRRWFGNMLRTNSRALKVPIKVMGFFTWWNLMDQRISMWTSLFGLTAGIIASLKYGPAIALLSVWWISLIRFMQALMLLSSREKISITWPFFIYFNQIYGSLVKIYILNHLNKQKWTRQNTTFKMNGNYWQVWLQGLGSKLSMAVYFLAFITAVTFVIDVFDGRDIYRSYSDVVFLLTN